jgi:hypothetical protein
LPGIPNKDGLQSGVASVTFTASDNFTSSRTVADLNGKYNHTIVAQDWNGLDKNGNKITSANNTLQLIVQAGGDKNQAQKPIDIAIS